MSAHPMDAEGVDPQSVDAEKVLDAGLVEESY